MALKPEAACNECEILLSRYEAATFSLARLHNALMTAEGLHDLQAVQRLSLEAHATAFLKKKAHAVWSEHRAKVHGEISCVADSTAGILALNDRVQ